MASRRPCKDTEKKRRQLKCVNRLCRDGENLVDAMEMVCRYYSIDYKYGKMVCKNCFKKALAHYKRAEILMKEGKCAMECNFPNFDKHFVIDSSSEDESEPLLPLDSKTTDCLNVALNYCIDKNKDLIEKQAELCDKYLDDKIVYAQNRIKEFDDSILEVENELEEWRNELYQMYTPIINNVSCVDIDDIVDNEIEKENEVDIISQERTNMQQNNKYTEDDKTDKDVIISVNHTLCDVPADLPKEGKMFYPFLKVGDPVYAVMNSSTGRWEKCKVLNIIVNGYTLVSCNKVQKLIGPGDVAYFHQNPVRYHVGSRVISKYTYPSVNLSSKIENFLAGIVAEPPTVLNEFRYMIFYDEGRVQYRHHKDIRLITYRSSEVWKCVNNNNEPYKVFLQRYLEKYPERHMVRLANKHTVTAKSDGRWMGAKVMEVDASLVRLYFLESKKIEWLYRGSPRLLNIHEKLKGYRMRQSGLEYLNKPFVEFTTVQEEHKGEKHKRKNLKEAELEGSCSTAVKTVAVKNTTRSSETTLSSIERMSSKSHENNKVNYRIIPVELPKNRLVPKIYFAHECNPSCIDWTEYDYSKTRDINVLAIPSHFGFTRGLIEWESDDSDTNRNKTTSKKFHKLVMYIGPCGRVMRTMKEMLAYLMATKSKMTIELFDFNSWVNTMEEFKVLSHLKFIDDISLGREFKKISCINSLTNTFPPNMKYITSRRPMPGVNINTDHDFLCGCDCTDNCQDKSKCACWQLTIKNQNIIPLDSNEYDPNIGYHYRRLPERVITGIYECNSTCKCSNTCLNRVVQHPLSQKLQLFMTEKKGWGVRCLNDIPSGSFICIYVGYLLTENDANHGGLNYGDEYLAELDYIEVVEKTKEGYEETAQLSEDDKKKSKNNDDKNHPVSETSDEDYQVPLEKASIVVSDIASRLRKRKKPERLTRKKNRGKKDGKHMPPKPKARVLSPEPQKSVRDYFGKNENVYIMDAKTSGNIGRYINHSCSPNIFVQNVFVDTHDIRFPWISFFALHYIPAGTELTWDYSYDIGSVPGKKMMCYCESTSCRKRLL